MLEELIVHNFALIDRISIKFAKGLNILSGETGAGKSILIGALGLLLGQKGDPASIRSGTEEALVSGVLRVHDNPELLQWLKENGIDPEDGCVILRRNLKKSGRGSIYIQSIPVTLASLREFTALIIDMHGQHDHQSLLVLENHRKVLDKFARCEEKSLQFREAFLELKSLKERFAKLQSNERERLRQIDILKHSIAEIEEAKLKPKEDEELDGEHRLLANHERLYELLEQIYNSIAENRGGALSGIRHARSQMDELAEIDPALSSMKNQLEDAFYEMEDFIEGIRGVRDQTKFDPERLKAVEERLAEIRLLKKKYGNTIEEITAYADESRQELAAIENWEEDRETLKTDIQKREREIISLADQLSAERKKAAEQLQKRVEDELKNLAMPKVQFKVQVSVKTSEAGKPVIGLYGKDEIEFVISPNVGEPFKKLKSIASGGELSRVMLALKSALAEADNIACLIFDEIDAGIGGEVALSVGERLAKLSRLKQILCITHLATIAVRADNHLKVEKNIDNGRTFTSVKLIHGKEQTEEIARMLSGDKQQEVSIRHAEELIEKYGSSRRA
ncbi:MAG: DNA repair protein RecN [Spirochaetales bacterium]|nr:DNA repair protein RecN [Spirochaetales bacterium]